MPLQPARIICLCNSMNSEYLFLTRHWRPSRVEQHTWYSVNSFLPSCATEVSSISARVTCPASFLACDSFMEAGV